MADNCSLLIPNYKVYHIPSKEGIALKIGGKLLELIKELLKAVAEYSQLNREEFLETVKKAQTSQQSSEITRLKSRLAEAKKRVQELEKLICRIYEDNILGKLPDERYAILDGQYSKEQKGLWFMSVTEKEALRQLRKWKSILILLENIYHHISVRWK